MAGHSAEVGEARVTPEHCPPKNPVKRQQKLGKTERWRARIRVDNGSRRNWGNRFVSDDFVAVDGSVCC